MWTYAVAVCPSRSDRFDLRLPASGGGLIVCNFPNVKQNLLAQAPCAPSAMHHDNLLVYETRDLISWCIEDVDANVSRVVVGQIVFGDFAKLHPPR